MKTLSIQDIREQFAAALHTHDDAGDPSKARTRARILAASHEHFVRYGYRRASMADIARDAGVAKGTLYLYFSSKSDLMIGTIAKEKFALMPRIVALFEGPKETWLRGYIDMIGTISTDMPLVTRLLNGDREMLAVMDDMPGDARGQMMDMGIAMLEEIIEGAAPGLSPQTLRNRAIVLRSIAMTSAQLADERVLFGLSIPQFSEAMTDILVHGLTAPETTS